ncbi:MAG TPA: hypothetical protein VG753_00020 [Candidatus Paceibacterota bacterium]|nr:hypothetical protein [Candidatus Paceibacterota bacterium]
MRKYMFVLPVERMEMDQVFDSFPLHCTLVPWFYLHHTPTQILYGIMPVTGGMKPLTLTSEAEALFGPHKDISVHVLEPNPALIVLHTVVCDRLRTIGASFLGAEYMGANYRPHVTTRTDGRSFPPPSQLVVNEICLLEQITAPETKQKQKKVVAKISFVEKMPSAS